MNWTWNVRSNDGAMNGLEFARCTTAGAFNRVLIHAAPGQASVEIIDGDDRVVAPGQPGPLWRPHSHEADRTARVHAEPQRVWPAEEHHGLPVLLSGGEVGILQRWQHAGDHSCWRWPVKFSNHTGRPDDWAPPGQHVRRGS